jgi:hypothetical protein
LLAPTGTVTFNVYGPIIYPFVHGPGSCAGAPRYTSINPVNSASSAISDIFTPPEGEEKIYLFTANYSGDAVYAPVTSECDAPGELVRVPLVTFALPEPIVAPPAAPPGSVSPPISISRLTFSPAVFAVNGNASAHKTKANKPMRRFAQGTTVSYVISGTSTVTITINKAVAGLHVVGRGCVPATAAARKTLLAYVRRNRASPRLHHASCKIFQRVGALTRSSRVGSNSFIFIGRLGSHVLTVGSYRADAAVIGPTASSSSTASATFQIIAAAG